MAAAPEELHADILDQYLSALQAGQARTCADLLRAHPELAGCASCLNHLHDLANATTLPPQPRATTVLSSLMVGAQFGKYRLDAELGRGGMGVVYQAYQTDLKRHVALKLILHGQLASSDQVTRFLAEARAAAKVQHPHVVEVYEVGEHAGQHFIAMEYLDGMSLDQLLRENKAQDIVPSPDDVVHFLLPLVQAVHALHRSGFIHRDLKPGNILLQHAPPSNASPAWGTAYLAKIADFGLAKSLLREDGLCTASGIIVGTPSYMAPEQASVQDQLSPAVDVYSLGAILYELLTGRPPFKAGTMLDTLVMVLENEPARPRQLRPQLSRKLEAIVLKALEKDPARRYASAEALAADLTAYLTGDPVQAQPFSPWRRFLHWTRREPALASHVGALLAFAAIIQVNYHLSGNVDLKLHAYVLALLGIWIMLSILFQSLLRKQFEPTKVACVWTATDVLIFSLVLMIRGVETGPLIIGFPILVAVSGLWFRASVVWFTTIAAEVGVLMLMPYWHGWDYLRANPHHPALVLVMIAVLGMVMAYQVERVCMLSRFYGSRSMPGQ